MRCHGVLHVDNPISPHANINLHVMTWAQDPATWNSLYDARLSHGSMLYNPQERLVT